MDRVGSLCHGGTYDCGSTNVERECIDFSLSTRNDQISSLKIPKISFGETKDSKTGFINRKFQLNLKSITTITEPNKFSSPSFPDRSSQCWKGCEDECDKKYLLDKYRLVCSQVRKNGRIYISGMHVSQDLHCLKNSKITHIINMVGDSVPNRFPKNFTYLTFYLLDEYYANEEVQAILYNSLEYIQQVLSADESHRILIHCKKGVSRSATLVIAYLMWSEKIGFLKGLEILKETRSFCNPNTGFTFLLLRFEKLLFSNTISSIEGFRRKNKPPLSENKTLFSALKCSTSNTCFPTQEEKFKDIEIPDCKLEQTNGKEILHEIKLDSQYSDHLIIERKLFRVCVHHQKAPFLVALGVSFYESFQRTWFPSLPVEGLDPRFFYILRDNYQVYLWEGSESLHRDLVKHFFLEDYVEHLKLFEGKEKHRWTVSFVSEYEDQPIFWKILYPTEFLNAKKINKQKSLDQSYHLMLSGKVLEFKEYCTLEARSNLDTKNAFSDYSEPSCKSDTSSCNSLLPLENPPNTLPRRIPTNSARLSKVMFQLHEKKGSMLSARCLTHLGCLSARSSDFSVSDSESVILGTPIKYSTEINFCRSPLLLPSLQQSKNGFSTRNCEILSSGGDVTIEELGDQGEISKNPDSFVSSRLSKIQVMEGGVFLEPNVPYMYQWPRIRQPFDIFDDSDLDSRSLVIIVKYSPKTLLEMLTSEKYVSHDKKYTEDSLPLDTLLNGSHPHGFEPVQRKRSSQECLIENFTVDMLNCEKPIPVSATRSPKKLRYSFPSSKETSIQDISLVQLPSFAKKLSLIPKLDTMRILKSACGVSRLKKDSQFENSEFLNEFVSYSDRAKSLISYRKPGDLSLSGSTESHAEESLLLADNLKQNTNYSTAREHFIDLPDINQVEIVSNTIPSVLWVWRGSHWSITRSSYPAVTKVTDEQIVEQFQLEHGMCNSDKDVIVCWEEEGSESEEFLKMLWLD